MTPAVMSWSSGKDSAYALQQTRIDGRFDVRALLTTVNETHQRVAMHGVRRDVLRMQARALRLPLVEVLLPHPCGNAVYESRMAEALARLNQDGVADCIFGDLFLEDVRAYREKQLAAVNMRAHFPIWKRDTATLAHEMIDAGFDAYIAALDPAQLAHELCGAKFNAALLTELPNGVDPCGENGEFHTVVAHAPGFSAALSLRKGETLARDGFVYTDFMPAN